MIVWNNNNFGFGVQKIKHWNIQKICHKYFPSLLAITHSNLRVKEWLKDGVDQDYWNVHINREFFN
jgi:hypothetical protein